eukprot:TRINITY_DN27054_c0_g1_i1.p1 TRINITY_DN27054_c0_g1~~TRINITY_DN27054_c0_g1_i1.p1  ORF type:complete len:359 (+),score=59.07 TRINITY_DN27054_c0_g1_i1:138-1214(+)
MQQISVTTNVDTQLLKHSPSDDALVNDVEQVVSAPSPYISHLVASRTKQDKAELVRILRHLPMVRNMQSQRNKDALRPASVAAPPSREDSSRGWSRGSAFRCGGAKTVQVPGLGLGATSPPGGSPGGSDARSVSSRGGARGVFAAPGGGDGSIARSNAFSGSGGGGGVVTAFGGDAPNSRTGTPRLAGGLTPTPRSRPHTARSGFSSGSGLSDDAQVDRQRRDAQARAEMTERVTARLAELGVDPKGLKAGEVLQLLYARGGGSTYAQFNREAESRFNVRVATPRCFKGMLTERGFAEIRRARELPVTNVHECLDHWEIEFLADVCRSLRHFGQKCQGTSSEYTRMCENKQMRPTIFK